MSKSVALTHSRWHHSFSQFQFSTQEFYYLVENSIKEREIPNTKVKRIEYSQSGLFSNKREYLRIQRGEYTFDICAAPFGKDFFVSYWFGEFSDSLLSKVPIIGPFFSNANKTRYQMDTEVMFQSAVKNSLKEAIEIISKEKGAKALSPADYAEEKISDRDE